jgi:RNA-directed DNA polymerase
MIEIAQSLQAYVPGWKAYFQLAQTPRVWRGLDEWLRRRLRAMQLKLWRHGADDVSRAARAGRLRVTGARSLANHGRRWWRYSWHGRLNRLLTIAYFDRLGVPRLS